MRYKILHIIDSLGLGGAQTIIKGIFDNQQFNTNIYLYALRKNDINIEIQHSNINIHDSMARFSFAPLKRLKAIIENEKIEILHCHLFRSQVFGFLLKKRYFPFIKLIFQEHGQVFGSEANNKIEDQLFWLFLQLSKKKVNKFIAVSKATETKLLGYAKINSSKIVVLYNFVNFTKNDNEQKKIPQKKGNTDFNIGYVGRLSKIKGCEFLITALSYLNFKYKVLIAGDGNEKENLIKISEKNGVEMNISFLGYVVDVNTLYNEFDVLVVPSIHESFGISAIEAFFKKVPVIASDIEGLNEIVIHKKNGLLFKAKNAKDLADKITQIYTNDKQTQELISNASADVKKYSLDNYLEELSSLYNKITAN